jgi:RNA polymerase sigma factor (sigma-70 family)
MRTETSLGPELDSGLYYLTSEVLDKWPGNTEVTLGPQQPPGLFGPWQDGGLANASLESQTEIDEARALLGYIAEGDFSAFWRLWQRYNKYLFAVCLRHMGGIYADAEDALSRAMLKAMDRLPQHASVVINPRAWLTRLTYNVCMEMHREHTRRRMHVEIGAQIPIDLESPGTQFNSPEDSLLRDEALGVLAGMINELPPRLREPFVLRYWHEIPCRQVAERLTLSTENVRKRIQQARGFLRARLDRYLSSVPGKQPARPDRGHSDCGQPERGHWLASLDKTGVQEKQRRAKAGRLRFWPVSVTMPSGEKSDTFILLHQKPTRQRLKLKTLVRYVENHPRGWKKRLETADLFYIMGEWDEALRHYQYVLKKQPRLIDVWMRMANLLRLTERQQESAATYECALALAVDPCLKDEIRGFIDLCRGDWLAAARWFERAAEMQPKNAIRWRDVGLVNLAGGIFDRAAWSFDNLLELDGDNLVALTLSYDALLGAGRLEEGYKRLSRALELDPNGLPALKRMAEHRCSAGLVKGAEGAKTRSLIIRLKRLAPNRVDVNELLALFHFRRSESEPGPGSGCFAPHKPDRRFAWWLLGMADYGNSKTSQICGLEHLD